MNPSAKHCLALLMLLGSAVQAAPMCEIDPVAHHARVLQGENGSGGIGGTGAPAIDNGGGIGGTGVQVAEGTGGIGGTGAPLRVPLAGRVMFAHGTALALRGDGMSRPLRVGEPVCEGDSVDTAQDGLVQLAMADGGRLDVRAQSRMRIDHFVLPENMDGSERFAATLEWGSLQATTGDIGHVHKELYLLHTPLAEIGVRGTSHEVFHVPQALPGIPAGTYNRVLSGATVLRSSEGALDLAPAQAGFIPLGGGKPSLLDHLPAALSTQNILGLSAAWRHLSKNLRSEEEPAAVYLKPLTTIEHQVDMTALSPWGSAYVGASQDLAAGQVRVGGVVSSWRNHSVIVLDPSWGLPSAVADTTNGFNFFTTDVTNLFDLGLDKVDGVYVLWGLYGQGNDVDPLSGAMRNVDFHHFAFAPRGITPASVLNNLSGTASFGNLVGSTMLTDESGSVGGQLNTLQIGVQFGPQIRVTSYQLNATDAQSRTWNAQFSGNVGLPDFRAGRLPLTVQCSGDGCGSSTGSGSAAGVVIGNNGKGIITSYGLQTSGGAKAGGVAVVSRP
ncbi:hypothetical protein [Vogesella sp. LIG4]|uniref:FecR family protein n=1 Tax=Vogesella sp. LIG4 TaxID=1192162 RepID=UPI00081FFB4B|nr:hypothetical protein [Vogesella sp. LIG4]SCK15369.1 hypothetical protein PSELUDRAFT_1522 [Vogesella sp. LIG4]